MSGPNTAGRTAPDAGGQSTPPAAGGPSAPPTEGGQNTKAQLRRLARRCRADRTADERREATRELTGRVLDLARGRIPNDAVIASYLSLPDEPDTHPLVDSFLEAGYRVMVPYMTGGPAADDIDWAWYTTGSELSPGVLGIDRPRGEPLGAPALSRASVVILPGLAGGRDGSRLGMGAGWYDRALAHTRPGTLLWLLLFDDEVTDTLPQEPHDHAVGVIITPHHTIVTADNGNRPAV